MTVENKTIKINKKNLPISCPNELTENNSHPKIFLNETQSICKYCNTKYIIV
jgi:uncharacterized Zn-finger protein